MKQIDEKRLIEDMDAGRRTLGASFVWQLVPVRAFGE